MTTDATTTPPPAAPAVDIDAIVKAATEKATEAAKSTAATAAAEASKKTRQEIANAISGGSGENAQEKVLNDFLKDPLKVLHATAEHAANTVREELAAQTAKTTAMQKVQQQVVGPVMAKYPDLSGKKLALVEKIAEQQQAAGKTYAEALKIGCDETIEAFGLKSTEQIEADTAATAAALPNGGSLRASLEKFDNTKSSSDFLQGMKDRHKSMRVRK